MAIGTRQTFRGAHIRRMFGTNQVTMKVIKETSPRINVHEADSDVETRIQLETNDRLVVSADGNIWAGVWLTGNNGPQGWNNIDGDPKFPLPGSHPYALLGKLDDQYFYIGRGWDRFYGGEGSDFLLRINDDAPGNGSGAFRVKVQQWRRV